MNELIQQHLPALHGLCRQYNVRRLDLIGSAAKGTFGPDSDLDFLVEFHDYTPENAADRFLGLLTDLQDLFKREVDLVSNKAIRNPYFRQSVDRDRVALYAA